MKDLTTLHGLAADMLGAWNLQDVERVLSIYTEDLRYRDPNTRGEVQGRDGMRRYLTKLFQGWQMHWSLRELFPLRDHDGAAVLWRATFRKTGGQSTVEADGMDLVVFRADRIERNEVYFDRAALAPLLGVG